ncbi:hypothetical protein [Saccharothrix texasensis]|uniref:hypothetical protein n=1 Tax=Saccharothrix texasensis TaxID=103734 RepID=UPI001476C15E|nr:hypothetical protein [Saccharothrix texasensis]
MPKAAPRRMTASKRAAGRPRRAQDLAVVDDFQTAGGGEGVGVLDHAQEAVDGGAAQRVEEGVVAQVVDTLAAGHGDRPVLDVDGGDPGRAQVDAGAGEQVRQAVARRSWPAASWCRRIRSTKSGSALTTVISRRRRAGGGRAVRRRSPRRNRLPGR